MILPLREKHRTTGWRANIVFDNLLNLLKAGLIIGIIACGLAIANMLRQKSGGGWFDFLSPFGKYFVMVKPVFKRPFTLCMTIAVAAAAFILWLMLSPDAPEDPRPAYMRELPPTEASH